MEDDRRTRVLEAMVELMAERRTGMVSISETVARAGISEEDYVKLFGNREGALLAAFDVGVERAAASMYEPFEVESRWLDAVKSGLAGFLRFLEAEPAFGRLLVVYSLAGGERVLRRRMEVLGVLTAIVDRGRRDGVTGRHPPAELMAEGVIGGVLAIVHNDLVSAESRAATELYGSLISMIVLPYLGASVARREQARPAPKYRRRVRIVEDEPDEGSRARLSMTYRTTRVLRAIRDYPGASNREVAERAGIVDQGQISKLLARLEARGMIEKAGEKRARGAPNSWCLTERGERALSG